MKAVLAGWLAALALTALASCSIPFFPEEEEAAEADKDHMLADYRSADYQGSDKLIRPPNILADVRGEMLLVNSAASSILPEVTHVRVVREGAATWLEVDLPAEEVWPVIRRFWLDEGFGIDMELPEAGIIETDWQQDRSQVLGTGITRLIDIALERLHDTGERHRFRTRVERIGDSKTEIFISFRGIIEKTTNNFERQPPDPTLEAEMLRRLLLYFRPPRESVAALTEGDANTNVADSLYEASESELLLKLDYDLAWQRVGIALDRSGFTVTSRDKDAGLIELLYAERARPPESYSILDRLRGKSAQQASEPFPVLLTVVSVDAGNTRLTVDAPDNGPDIIRALADNL